MGCRAQRRGHCSTSAVLQEYGYWAENSGEGQQSSGMTSLKDTRKVVWGVKLQPTDALGLTVSAGGKLSVLSESDRNRKHTGRSMLFSHLPFL